MLGVTYGLWWPKQNGLRAMTEIWVMGSKSPHTNMGYQQMYGLSQSMYGLYPVWLVSESTVVFVTGIFVDNVHTYDLAVCSVQPVNLAKV